MMGLRTLTIAGMMLLLLGSRSPARVIDVPDDFETIQGGIDAAEDGDTVLVQPGVYVENTDFSGRAITVASLVLTTGDDAYIDSTVIDGDRDGHSTVLFYDCEGRGSFLVGFTVRNGYTVDGGGICCAGSNITLTDLKICDNTAEIDGGGIFCAGGSSLLMRRVEVSDNESNSAAGGGIYICDSSSVTIEDSKIESNFAREFGGGIYCSSSRLVLSRSTLSDNEARFGGGGLYSYSESVVLEAVFGEGNRADVGAGIYCSGSDMSLRNSTLVHNQADRFGGAVYGSGRIWRIVNSTVADNSAESSGGVGCRGTADFVVLNSIFRNEGFEVGGRVGDGFELGVSFSDIEDGVDGISRDMQEFVRWGEGNSDADPLFTDPDEGDYHLTEDSPCVDAGTAFFMWEGDTLLDLSEDDYNGLAPDMGAFESEFFNSAPDHFIPRSSSLILHLPFPNPFNRCTTVRYALARRDIVALQLFDLRGRMVKSLDGGLRGAGGHRVTLEAGALPSGVYLLCLNGSTGVRSRKLALVR